MLEWKSWCDVNSRIPRSDLPFSVFNSRSKHVTCTKNVTECSVQNRSALCPTCSRLTDRARQFNTPIKIQFWSWVARIQLCIYTNPIVFVLAFRRFRTTCYSRACASFSGKASLLNTKSWHSLVDSNNHSIIHSFYHRPFSCRIHWVPSFSYSKASVTGLGPRTWNPAMENARQCLSNPLPNGWRVHTKSFN